MKWNLGMKIVSYRSTAKPTDTAASVDHTHKALEGLGQLTQALADAETRQRG